MRAGGKHNDLENVGCHQPSPHVLRDAGQFQLRRLLQEGRHRLRVGAVHLARVVRPRQEQAVRNDLQGRAGHRPRHGSLRPLARDSGKRRRPQRAHLRDGHEGQLLADGRYRPLRPVQRTALRHGPRGQRCRPHRLRVRLRVRALRRDLEPGLHAVRPPARRRDASAAQAVQSTLAPAWSA